MEQGYMDTLLSMAHKGSLKKFTPGALQSCIVGLLHEIKRLEAIALEHLRARADKDYVIELLLQTVEEACGDGSVVDSKAIPIYAEAIEYLIKAGRLQIVEQAGCRQVIAEVVVDDITDKCQLIGGMNEYDD